MNNSIIKHNSKKTTTKTDSIKAVQYKNSNTITNSNNEKDNPIKNSSIN